MTYLEKESHFQGNYAKRVFGTIALSYGPYARRVIATLCLGFFARGSLLFIPNVVGFWADSLCRGNTRCHLPPQVFQNFSTPHFVFLILLLTTVGFFANTVFRVGISRLGTHAISRLYDEVTLRTSRFPMSFYDRTPIGRIITRFSSDYSAVFRMAGGPMGEFFCIVFDLFFAMIFISLASPFYAPLVLFTVLVNYLVWRFNKEGLRQERRASSAARGPSIAHFNETTQGSSSIRVFGKSESFHSQMLGRMNEFLKQRASTFQRVQFFSSQMSFTTAFLLFATGVLGVFLIQSGRASVASVAVAFTFVMLTSTTVQQLFEYLATLEEALTGVERLDEYLGRPLEPGSQLPATAQFPLASEKGTESWNVPRAVSKGVLCVESLSLEYLPGKRVLQDLSFSLQDGESLGVVGRTGSGKSSLLQALLFLYPWADGALSIQGKGVGNAFIKGQDTASLSLEEHRSLFSFLPQDPVLFRGNLLENLSLEGSITDPDLLQNILQKVGLFRYLRRPKELCLVEHLQKWQVEERGLNFSLGERQLICLARCLLQDRPFFLMDEATSHIDPVSERHLDFALRESLSRKTRILIAHRLSTVEQCDRILWMENGRVRALGPTREVLKEYQSSGRASAT